MNSPKREKKNKIPGMDKEFLGNGKASLFMKYYTEESIELFNEDLDERLSSQKTRFKEYK